MLDIPNNLHLITDAEAESLCAALRQRLVEVVSRSGGHLASNLGAVELTVALHRVFAPERDRIVFDVGHQCYCHKILTGRDGLMDTLRSFGGVSGFPKPGESVCDAFSVGHASTAVSVAVGMARARTLQKKDYHVVALLGGVLRLSSAGGVVLCFSRGGRRRGGGGGGGAPPPRPHPAEKGLPCGGPFGGRRPLRGPCL